MTPNEQLDYLIGQVAQLNSAVEAGNAGNDSEKVRKTLNNNRHKASHLLGYMTAMEHAGNLPQAIASELAELLTRMEQR